MFIKYIISDNNVKKKKYIYARFYEEKKKLNFDETNLDDITAEINEFKKKMKKVINKKHQNEFYDLDRKTLVNEHRDLVNNRINDYSIMDMINGFTKKDKIQPNILPIKNIKINKRSNIF